MDLTGSSILVLQYFRKCWSRKLCEPETDTAEQCAGLSPSCSVWFVFLLRVLLVQWAFISTPHPSNSNGTLQSILYAPETTSLPNLSAISDLPSCQKAISLRFNGDVWLAWTTYIYLLVITEPSTHNAGKMPTQWLSKLKQNGLLSLTSQSRRSLKKIKPWGESKQASLKFRSSRHFCFPNSFNSALVQ